MIDDPAIADFGLGQIDSEPDERDWSIDTLYAMAGLDVLATPPPAFLVRPPYPPVLNQHASPMCVAYSSAFVKGYEDLRDTGAAVFDEPTFFREIGGNAQGAVLRVALARLVSDGYPVAGSGQAARHRIASYYVVPVDQVAIQSAIANFGPVLLGTTWFHSWFRPVAGVLPIADTSVGGHAIAAVGWDSRGLRLRNSWGPGWGLAGDAFLPWQQLYRVREAWKAIDQVIVPPASARYRIRIAPGATVRTAHIAGGCISGWTDRKWGRAASGAPSHAPVVKRGCVHGQATVALVSAGAFAGKFVRIGGGVSIERIRPELDAAAEAEAGVEP